MPGNISCKILDADGNKEEILDYSTIRYTVRLNNKCSFEIVIKGSNSFNYNKYLKYKLSNGSGNEQGVVYFYKSNFLEMKGIVTDIKYNSGGQMVLVGVSTDVFGSRNEITTTSRGVETPTVRVTAFIGDIYRLGVGTLSINESGNMTAATYKNLNPIQAIKDVVNNYDGSEYFLEFVDDASDELNVTHTFSTTSVLTLLDGVDFKYLKRNEDPKTVINKCTFNGAYSSADGRYYGGPVDGGDDRGTYTDTTSQTTYGTSFKDFTDRTITSDAECLNKSTNYVNNNKSPINHIIINGIVNVDLLSQCPNDVRVNGRFALGDTITVISRKTNIESAELKIIGFVRSINNNKQETLTFLTVVNTVKLANTGEIIIKNNSIVAGGAIAGSAETKNTANTSSEVNAGGGGSIAYSDPSGYTATSLTISANATNTLSTSTNNITVHNSMVVWSGCVNFLNSSLKTGWNYFSLYLTFYGSGDIQSTAGRFEIYKPGHTHTGASHVHAGPTHAHGTGDASYPFFRIVDSSSNESARYPTAYVGGNTGSTTPGAGGSSSELYTPMTFYCITTTDFYGEKISLRLASFVSSTATYNISSSVMYAPLHNHSVTTNNVEHTTGKGTLNVAGET